MSRTERKHISFSFLSAEISNSGITDSCVREVWENLLMSLTQKTHRKNCKIVSIMFITTENVFFFLEENFKMSIISKEKKEKKWFELG